MTTEGEELERAHWESCIDDDCVGCVTPAVNFNGLEPVRQVKLSELVAAKKENIFSIAEIRRLYGQSPEPDEARQGILGETGGE